MVIALIVSGAVFLVAMGFFAFALTSLQSMLGEKELAEDRLMESQRHLQSIIDNTTALISVTNREGRYQLLNKTFEAVFGISRVDALDKRPQELLSPEVAEMLSTKDDKVLSEGLSVEFDLSVQTPAGERSYLTVKFPLHDVAGRRYAVCTVMTDITQRELAHAQRRRIFNLSLDMMAIAGVDGYPKLVNPQFEKTLGFTAEEMLAAPIVDFVHPDDREATREAIARIARGEAEVDFENRCLCKDGSYKRLSWRVAPDLEEGCMIAVAREIIPRKELAAAATGGGEGSHSGKVVRLPKGKH